LANLRKPFQGITNIIRFNWHFYILSIILILLWITIGIIFDLGEFKSIFWILFSLGILANAASLLASWYIYDASNLYSMDWLGDLGNENSKLSQRILNIHAGFDETSDHIQQKFVNSKLQVFDFYDGRKHTEISIERARKAYPAHYNTIKINTNHIPLQDHSVDKIFLILSAHEIRNPTERINFFKECKRILKSNGSIIVLEHLRDIPNFLVYTIGFLHFHSHATWLNTFQESGLILQKEKKVTPYLSYFHLITK